MHEGGTLFTFKLYCELLLEALEELLARQLGTNYTSVATFLTPVSCRLGRMELDIAPIHLQALEAKLTDFSCTGSVFTSRTDQQDATLGGDAPMVFKVHAIILQTR